MRTINLIRILVLTTLVACGGGNSGSNAIGKCTKDTVNVLIIGDSISEGYTPFVQEALGDKYYIQHNVTKNGYTNAETSGFTLSNIEDYLDDCPKWDVITFGNGLWDIAQENGNGIPRGGTVNDYTSNLQAIADRLQDTGAAVVFFNMIPVETGDNVCLDYLVDPWNSAAFTALSTTAVTTYDLNSWAHETRQNQNQGDVHYNDKGNKHNAQFVISAIKEQLGE